MWGWQFLLNQPNNHTYHLYQQIGRIMNFEAKIICDSICEGYRLTTMQITHWKLLQAQLNTHASHARNAASSRAIPFKKTSDVVEKSPFIPIYWGKNRKGMSPNEEIEEKDEAVRIWLEARDNALESARKLADLQVHKQLCNRLLEPFMWSTVAITADNEGWSNFFNQRCHADAQQELQHIAFLMQKAYFESYPDVLDAGQWHLPYVSREEKFLHEIEDLVKISTGRTARTSYLNQEGIRDYLEDINLHDRLTASFPLHLSPSEQVAMATPHERHGKYMGWKAYRKFISNEFVTSFEPNYEEYFSEHIRRSSENNQ